MIGVQFDNITGGDINVAEAFKTSADPVSQSQRARAPMIKIWKPAKSTYVTLYYFNDALDVDGFDSEYTDEEYERLEEEEEGSGDAWVDELMEKYARTGWAETSGNLYTGTLAASGKGFWMILPTGTATATLTFTNPTK